MIARWSTLIASLIVLGGCGRAVIQEGDPLWRVPIFFQGNCASIDGKYADNGLLFRQFNDTSINYSTSKFSTSVKYDRRIVPFGEKNPRDFQKAFDANAFVEIRKTPSDLEVTLYGGDKIPYEGRRISFSHPNVGCDASGNLVLREFSRHGGAELTPGEADASEAVFRKLEGGSLEVHRWGRNWVRTMQSPPRKESQTILTFQPVH
ncbi:hypothetical protein ACQ858_07005 [Variovorax ureilyticus]|uniref:hypothetical protein n=1 Tax=Variovorax ureilyticus TaxID=1836198 RepID=UPI003D6737DA